MFNVISSKVKKSVKKPFFDMFANEMKLKMPGVLTLGKKLSNKMGVFLLKLRKQKGFLGLQN